MELSSVFGGDTLKAADLQGTEQLVTISRVEMKKFDNGNKLVIGFAGKKKALVCNKTNANRIAHAYGSNTDNWINQQVTLYVDLVDFQGNTVEAIRVRPPMRRASVAAGSHRDDPISSGPARIAPPADDSRRDNERSPQPPMRQAADIDDEIPF